MHDSSDLTLLFITAGELPLPWRDFHRSHLPDLPMVTVSRQPGADIHDTYPKCYENIYRQMLFAARLAKTPYVAMIEDDVLYSPEHFAYRPPLDTFAYNQHRWALFTWGEPTYSIRQRKSNCSLIAPRELLIEAIEERFNKCGDHWGAFAGELGRERVEAGLNVTPRKSIEWFSEIGIIQINHDNASEDRQRRHRKTLGQIKAYDIPHWGKAEDVIKKFL
jgi:hypothetical protein